MQMNTESPPLRFTPLLPQFPGSHLPVPRSLAPDSVSSPQGSESDFFWIKDSSPGQISEWFYGAVFFTTCLAFSVQVGKPSISPVNVSIIRNWHLGEVYLPVLSWVGPMLLGSWASWGLQAPWELFNWQVGQEQTTCLIVIWRPVPLKDFSNNLWRAFSPKWVVACKELTNFH